MSYRRPKPPHRQENERKRWLLEYADHLGAMGLPLRVFESWERWAEFLEMGCLARFEDTTHFSFEDLSLLQQARLLAFLDEHFGANEPPLLGWLRVRVPGHAPEASPRRPPRDR